MNERYGSTLRSARRLLLAAALGMSGSAMAVDVACVSLIGDVVTTADREPTAASSMPRRRSSETAQATPFLDDLAAKAAMAALVDIGPKLEVITVKLSGADMAPYYHRIMQGLDDQESIAAFGVLAADVAPQLKAERLLLVVKLSFKHWADRLALSGIGVYSNGNSPNLEDNYVAPFIGAAILVYDAKGKLLDSHAILGHKEFHADKQHLEASTNPMDILEPAALNRALQELIASEILSTTRAMKP